eukprot:41062_1
MERHMESVPRKIKLRRFQTIAKTLTAIEPLSIVLNATNITEFSSMILNHLKQNLDTISNYLREQTSNHIFYTLSLQIADTIATFVLTDKIAKENNIPYYTTSNTSSLNKALQKWIGKYAIKCARKCYAQDNICSIYNEWKQHNRLCGHLTTILWTAGSIARVQINLTHPSMENLTCLDKSHLTAVFETERSKTMHFGIKKRVITDAYIRCNSSDVIIPRCIADVITSYCEPISLKTKITQLFQLEIDKIIRDMSTPEKDIFEHFEACDRLVEMIYFLRCVPSKDYSFYIVHQKDVKRIVRAKGDAWKKQYLTGKIGIMEYADKIETFMEKARDNYQLDCAGKYILIASYIQCILDKHNGCYNTLVTALKKSELKRIYKLFMKSNETEAKKLNHVYKNRNTL